MTVLLATSNAHHGLFSHGEPGHQVLDAEFARRGVEARWVIWDDPEVDWAAADLVAVRSTWDYTERWQEFLGWAQGLDAGRLLNSAAIFEWNVDKSYLTRLGELDVPTIPTVSADTEAQARAAIARFGPSVVKPRVGAGGEGLLVIGEPDDPRLNTLNERPVVVQALVETVRTLGETSLYLIDGEPTAQILKHPTGGEVRVNEEHGGVLAQVAIDPACVELARAALEATRSWHGGDLPDYARIDLLQWQGAWHVSELELTEPGLYLDVTDANAAPFVSLVESRL